MLAQDKGRAAVMATASCRVPCSNLLCPLCRHAPSPNEDLAHTRCTLNADWMNRVEEKWELEQTSILGSGGEGVPQGSARAQAQKTKQGSSTGGQDG